MVKGSSIREIYLTLIWFISTYISWLCHHLLNCIKRQHLKEYINVEHLAQSIQECPKGSQIKILRNQRNAPSNSIRRPLLSLIKEDVKTKNKNIHIVNLGAGNRILSIDISSKSVTCEPGVTMEQLIDELLPYNLVPTVVPEFKSLTVGGVLAGAGLESSSFRYGQFGDSLIEATFILSDGRIINCSPTKDSDLFYGSLGSCGTFGLLVRATLSLTNIKSDCFVKCNYFRTNQPIETLSALHSQDYLDAIVFKDYTIIISGERTDKLSIPKTVKIQTFSKSWDPWFYQHVKTLHNKNDLTVITEYIPLKDYLFRYDRGAFWMGHYALNPLEDKIKNFPLFIRKILNLIPFGGYNIVSRTIFSPILTTSSLYKRLHLSSISTIEDTLLIQDIYIPISKAKKFLSFIQSKQLLMKDNEIIEPIWLCPIRGSDTPQMFSPHLINNRENNDDSLFINFGLWNHQHNWQEGYYYARNATKLLEEKAKRLGGRKMLYSLSYYTKKEWENIYDIQWYKQMKIKWDPQYAWGDLYHKLVQQ